MTNRSMSYSKLTYRSNNLLYDSDTEKGTVDKCTYLYNSDPEKEFTGEQRQDMDKEESYYFADDEDNGSLSEEEFAWSYSKKSFGKVFFYFFIYLFLTFIYFTSLREQDEAYINSSRWSMLVGLEPAYIRMWVTRSTTALRTATRCRLRYMDIFWTDEETELQSQLVDLCKKWKEDSRK